MRCRCSISSPAMVWYSRFSSSGSGMYCTRSSSGMWPFAVQLPSAFFWISWRASISSASFGRFPAMVSVTSLNVTIPSTEPNSSTTKAKWVRALRNCSSAESSGSASGKTSGWRTNTRRSNGSPRSDCCNRSMTCTTPSRSSSSSPPVTTSRVCWFFSSSARISLSGALRSMCSISWREVMMLLTVRWLRLSTRSIIRRSCGSKICWSSWSTSSEAVPTSSSASSFLPLSRRMTASVVRLRSDWLAVRKRRRLKIASWFKNSIITEKPIAAYR